MKENSQGYRKLVGGEVNYLTDLYPYDTTISTDEGEITVKGVDFWAARSICEKALAVNYSGDGSAPTINEMYIDGATGQWGFTARYSSAFAPYPLDIDITDEQDAAEPEQDALNRSIYSIFLKNKLIPNYNRNCLNGQQVDYVTLVDDEQCELWFITPTGEERSFRFTPPY